MFTERLRTKFKRNYSALYYGFAEFVPQETSRAIDFRFAICDLRLSICDRKSEITKFLGRCTLTAKLFGAKQLGTKEAFNSFAVREKHLPSNMSCRRHLFQHKHRTQYQKDPSRMTS